MFILCLNVNVVVLLLLVFVCMVFNKVIFVAFVNVFSFVGVVVVVRVVGRCVVRMNMFFVVEIDFLLYVYVLFLFSVGSNVGMCLGDMFATSCSITTASFSSREYFVKCCVSVCCNCFCVLFVFNFCRFVVV